MPTSTGYEIRTDSSYAWDGRARGQTPFTVLQHTVAGAGNLLYERRRYRLLPGDTMLCVVPHNHRYWVEDGGRWEFFWLSITGQEAVRVHRLIQAATGPVFRLKPETIEHLAGLSLRLIDGEGEAPGAASAIAYEAAMTLYDEVFRSHGGGWPEGGDRAMRAVLDHVRANLDKPLAVADLAETAGLSRAHFSRMFASERRPAARRVRAGGTDAARGAAAGGCCRSAGQGNRRHVRLRRPQLFRQSVPTLLRHQPDRIPHDRHVRRSGERSSGAQTPGRTLTKQWVSCLLRQHRSRCWMATPTIGLTLITRSCRQIDLKKSKSCYPVRQ